jgi:hypothetical protein
LAAELAVLAFVVWEARTEAALVPLLVFGNRGLTVVNVIMM